MHAVPRCYADADIAARHDAGVLRAMLIRCRHAAIDTDFAAIDTPLRFDARADSARWRRQLLHGRCHTRDTTLTPDGY